jgi:RNA polymerase sigma factor (sigma-70 family)
MDEDRRLLAEYVDGKSQEAFSRLVERHIGMVHSTALRAVQDVHFADDAAQAVFLLLWRNAARIGPDAVIAGWLFKTTRHVCADMMKRQRRRKVHESQAVAPAGQNDRMDVDWERINPLLNDAVARLSRHARDAVVLRFFQGRSYGEIGSALGISEDAAKMRVQRAVEKLRNNLGQAGLGMAPAALGRILEIKAIGQAPAGVAGAASHPLLASEAFKAIARRVALRGRMFVGVMASTVLGVTLAAAAPLVWYLNRDLPTEMPSLPAEIPQAPPAVPAAQALAQPIKVGVLLSYFTATGPHWTVPPYGWGQQTSTIPMLKDRSIELIPVIEPGTAQDDPLPTLLARYFLGKTPLDASKADQLRTLDVLVTIGTADIRDDVVSAIDDAVSHGTGLLKGWFGFAAPGYTPTVQQLCGLSGAEYEYSNQLVNCVVAADSPLLGDLSGQMGQTIRLLPNGEAGTLTGTPLLKLKGPADAAKLYNENGIPWNSAGSEFYPLYVSQLGQGRIVGIEFAQYRSLPSALDAANHGRFYIHCVQWLANKPVQ